MKEFLEKVKVWILQGSGKIVLPILAFVLVSGILLALAWHQLFPAEEVPETEGAQKTIGGTETEEEEVPRFVEQGDEMRGVYIASVLNINFPSKTGLDEAALKAEMDRILAVSSDTGFDTIFLQVRPTGDALYNSEIFPTSRYLVKEEGEDAPLDVLAYFTEKAGELGLKTVAWVNPYRITNFTSKTKDEALAALSDKNPAKLHPDWTVFYGGKLYYNPALEEVEDLICRGVEEICTNYAVAGILYDDYFYPYPVEGESFDDGDAFDALAKNGQSLAEFRRGNVNRMVKRTYETVKSVSADLSFGVSPFGIWQNASSNPAGSNTRGMEAYHSLYCDALAWIRGGYVDYISPQIYWQMGYTVADFATLTRWWSAQVDGTPVKLIISHAAYRVEEFDAGAKEIIAQIQYARQYMNSAGSIQYGYAYIARDAAGLRTALHREFSGPYDEPEIAVQTSGIVFKRPNNNSTVTTSAQFVLCASDPKYPVYDAYGKVGRTKSGLFSVHMPLTTGKNTLELTQNGRDYTLTVNRKAAAEDTVKSFALSSPTPDPKKECWVLSGGTLSFSVIGPAGGTVTATLNGQTVTLKPTLRPNASGLMREVYVGEITLQGDGEADLGTIRYEIQRGGSVARAVGAKVKRMSADYMLSATVVKDYSFLKVATDTSFYEDYLNASAGMQDRVIAFRDGFYQLSFGGFIAQENVEVSAGNLLPDSTLTKATLSAAEREDLLLTTGKNTPLDARVKNGAFVITLYETKSQASLSLPKGDLLFQDAKIAQDGRNTVITMTLRSEKNYYGFDYSYTNDGILFSFTLPQKLAEGDQPLAGKTIIVDPGHGGADGGALGLLAKNEKDMNLLVSLALRDRLVALGANVIMSREGDETVDLYQRMDLLNDTHPDFSISVHHNSTDESSDANDSHGTLGLYWSRAGVSLAECVQQGVAQALGNGDLGFQEQELALCRNYKFPQTLVEIAFICSPAEYERMLDPNYAALCADGIVDGVLNWFAVQAEFLG